MEYNDEQLKKIMKMSTIKMPFDDFEDQVMFKVGQIEEEKQKVSKTETYALIFFALGAVFGLGLNYLAFDWIQRVQIEIVGKETILLSLQLLSVAFIVLFSHKVWRLVQQKKRIAKS